MAGKPEPTMEEILASIRRIIAEDDSERVREEPAEPEPESAPVDTETDAAAPVDEIDARFEDAPSAVLELSAAAAASRLAEAPDGAGLSSMLVRGEGGSSETLEGLVRQMLQPMLKSWLDANLPEIVEQMVAREIARITRK